MPKTKLENEISLREAARLTGYSSDYVGSLIRTGKISARRVVGTSAWVTTREAVLEYTKHNKGGRIKGLRNQALAQYNTVADSLTTTDPITTINSEAPLLVFLEGILVILFIFVICFFLYLFNIFSIVQNAEKGPAVFSKTSSMTYYV